MHNFLTRCRTNFIYAFFFSMFINVLQLTFPIYMLNVFDKVLPSHNIPTLFVITLAAMICLAMFGCLSAIRGQLLRRTGVEFDNMVSLTVLHENLKNASSPIGPPKQGTLGDVAKLRSFFSGNAITAFFDMPWMPLYFLLLFILHPWLGWVGVVGGLLVFGLGIASERLTRKNLEKSSSMAAMSNEFAGTAMRNANVVRAMGMIGAVSTRWDKMNTLAIELQTRSSRIAELLQAATKSIRMSLQILIYAIGAYLSITQQGTPGIMIAGSILMGRALAPLDLAMGTCKQSLEAHGAYKRLKQMLDSPPPLPMDLPAPQGAIALENIHFAVHGRGIIRGISCKFHAGKSTAIIGPSAAGKSTLCKLVLGIWEPMAGMVRIDGANLASWEPDTLGEYIGYLPQDVELFAGSIAENIARMGDVDPEKVVAAAQLAGVHQMVLQLPKGYDTPVGPHGAALSGGQRQRIGLARALYGNPRIIVLDEPNSNLDDEGEARLQQALFNLKKLHVTVLLVTHKPATLAAVDNILIMQDGQIAMYGPAKEIMAKFAAAQKQQQDAKNRRDLVPQNESVNPKASTQAGAETNGASHDA